VTSKDLPALRFVIICVTNPHEFMCKYGKLQVILTPPLSPDFSVRSKDTGVGLAPWDMSLC